MENIEQKIIDEELEEASKDELELKKFIEDKILKQSGIFNELPENEKKDLIERWTSYFLDSKKREEYKKAA